MVKSLRHFILSEKVPIREVAEHLNKNARGVVMLVREDGVMSGVMTDGDLRRAFLSNCQMDSPISDWLNRDFTAGSTQNSRQKNLSLLSNKLRYIPILDDDGKPVDILSLSEIWRKTLASPSLGGNESKYVSDCLSSGWISSQGRYVELFEQSIAAYTGARYALVTSSGTASLTLALRATGIGLGDEVVIPNLTFGACANAVISLGGKPVFCDITREHWTMDVVKLHDCLSPKTKAIMPVHLYGQPAAMDAIMQISAERNISVIEDCAEAIGATVGKKRVGSIGTIGAFSFFANKIVTTGEGGAVTTDNADLYERMKSLRDHGMDTKHRYWHLEAGFNFRMTNLQAALGVAQMEQIDKFISHRALLAETYKDELKDEAGVHWQSNSPSTQSVCWLFTVWLDPEVFCMTRDEIINNLAAHGIEAREVFHPLDIQPAYERRKETACPVSARIAMGGISLPSSYNMSIKDVKAVCECFKQQLRLARDGLC